MSNYGYNLFMHKTSTIWHVYLPRDKIALFQWILGEYDGLAQFHTLDRFKAVVELMIPPGNEPEVDRVIQALKEEWQCEIKLFKSPPQNLAVNN